MRRTARGEQQKRTERSKVSNDGVRTLIRKPWLETASKEAYKRGSSKRGRAPFWGGKAFVAFPSALTETTSCYQRGSNRKLAALTLEGRSTWGKDQQDRFHPFGCGNPNDQRSAMEGAGRVACLWQNRIVRECRDLGTICGWRGGERRGEKKKRKNDKRQRHGKLRRKRLPRVFKKRADGSRTRGAGIKRT